MHKKFWTFTVWLSRKSIEPFVRTEPPAEAVRRFNEWAGKGAAFAEWTSQNGQIDWAVANVKLQNPTFYYDKSQNVINSGDAASKERT
ncbi:MAG: hypothetical protein ABSD49_12665 [Candidatus Bathyarchaeia archaeon]